MSLSNGVQNQKGCAVDHNLRMVFKCLRVQDNGG